PLVNTWLLQKPQLKIAHELKIVQVPFMGASDGGELTLTCQHASASTNEEVHWYQQLPNKPPHYIVSAYSGKHSSNIMVGVSMTVAGNRKSSTLHFSRVTLKDSAVYFCALSDTVLCLGASAAQEPFPECEGEQPQQCKAAKPFPRTGTSLLVGETAEAQMLIVFRCPKQQTHVQSSFWQKALDSQVHFQ
uniref:Ig-like domain-containing protein n=1 Tax=Varanus komodoensis TaxID=61221 RepID=A0A8D2L7Y3_VARKO